MKRISSLRKYTLDNTPYTDAFYFYFFKQYLCNKNKNKFKNYADSFYYAFSTLTPSISENELIVGKYTNTLSQAEYSEWNNQIRDAAYNEISSGLCGQDSHMAINYELILHCGINGIIKKIQNLLLNCDADKKDFYNACITCLKAVIKHSENYAAVAAELAEKATDSTQKAELENISQICKKVPAEPAESFYEAVQSVHFVTHCLSVNPFRMCYQQFQLGHPDRYLLPYYLNDIKSGAITKEYAQLLLDCLGIQINNRVPNGLSSGYMLGGRDENNNIIENDLTAMCMQVISDIKLVYPAVGLCYTDNMDEKYLMQACEILLSGHSHPAIFNDDIITKGLVSYGMSEKDAHNYIHSTCVEITPVGSSNAWVASPYTNMVQILLDCLNKEYTDFDELMFCIFNKLDEKINENFKSEINSRNQRAKYTINPLLSCFVDDCLEHGTDIEQGGGRYNWIMPSFVGIANLVDSLYAVKEIVFEQKELTCIEFQNILKSNFENNETLRLKLLNKLPKYGNDNNEIDKYFGMITEHIISECKKYSGSFTNTRIIPSAFCWIMHERFGSETGATPDGRKAGFPLGDGSGPCQGREKSGPTASILSSTKWRHCELIGGVAVNMKFTKKSLGTSAVETMKNLIKVYMKQGGFEIQINVVDNETLEKARLNPEEYQDLVVRIGGYSDYFVRLSPNMQQEVILRTGHNL